MFATGKRVIFIEEILDVVDEYQIAQHYLGIRDIPCVINSPLREDRNPSFGVTFTNSGKISYLDFSTRDSGSLFFLLGKMWKLHFNDTLLRVFDDLEKIKSHEKGSFPGATEHKRLILSKNTKLQVKKREWKQHDIEYWEQYGLDVKALEYFRTFPISHIIVNKNKKSLLFGAERYAYVYVEFKDGEESLKTYQPYSKTYKWSNNHDASVWDLWEQLPPKGDNLIITSSRKDAMCIWKNTGIPSCSLQAESYLPKQQVIDELKERFTNIFILYDNDFDKEINYGRVFGDSLATLFDIAQIEIPEEYKSKDPSDLYKNHGKQALINTIKTLIC